MANLGYKFRFFLAHILFDIEVFDSVITYWIKRKVRNIIDITFKKYVKSLMQRADSLEKSLMLGKIKRGTKDQITNTHWIMEEAREFQKNIYFCFIDYAKAFDWVDHNKLWKILKEMGIPDHLTDRKSVV